MPFEYKVVPETLDLIPQLTENGSFFPVRNPPDTTVLTSEKGINGGV